MRKRVVIFVSGSGTNMENIVTYFKNHPTIEIMAVFSNNPNCLAIQKAKTLKINTLLFKKEEFETTDFVLQELNKTIPDLIVLAGFLLKVPQIITRTFTNKIINIHPSLLPKYGGKGMYGRKVHEAVLNNSEKETGITIHYVNEEYDKGSIIEQYTLKIEKKDTVNSLENKIHQMEKEYFPKVIEKLLV